MDSDKTIERIKLAVASGVKLRAISEASGITYYRIASVVNTDSYRYSSRFNKEECKAIGKALDAIKNSF